LYEFEIYAPDVVLPDAEAAQVVLDSINLPKSTQQNFTVPVSGIQDATIAWTSSHPGIISIGADGAAVVTLPETSTVVTLTAAVTVGEVTLEKEFPVNVKSADEAPVSYTLYPLVQNMQATADIISITSTVNVVVDGSVDSATKAYLAKVLADNGLTAVYSDAAVEGSTNLLVGVSGSNSAVDQYFAGVSYDASAIAGHHDAYVLDVSDNSENGTIAILGKDSDAVYYAVATLRQMLETNSSRATVLTLTDWADTQFRGFIEGFYGLPWSYEDRVSLMEFGQQFKMNSYIYGPKDDPYHRDSWRELYPDDQLADIVKLVEKGLETKVEFIWGIHPGFDIDLFSEADYQSMIAKFEQLYDAGVRQFSIFMDDIDTTKAYNEREQLVKVLNRVETEFVQAKGDVKPLVFVPSFYNKAWSTGSMGQSYLRALANLEPDIEIMWTGNSVMSDIDNNTIQWVRNLVGRDIYIWWNHPVNDYAKDSLLMGESYRLGNDVKNMSGFVSNPMNQAEASKVSLFSVADFTWNVGKFNQTTSWVHSFAFVAPDAAEALHTFSKNVSDPSPNGSGVVREESAYLTSTLNSFNSKLNAGQDLTEIGTQLADEFVNIQKACQELRASKANPGLVEEIEPWTRSLEQVALAGEKAVRAAMQLQDKNADPAAIWSNYSTASTAIQRAKTFTTLTDVGNTVVKAGSKRLQPFANNLIANLESRVRAAVLADLNDAKDTAKAYTNVAAYGQAAVTVGAASVTLEDLQDVTLQPGEYVGLQADTLKNVTEMTAQGLPDALTVQISENGVVWQEVPAEGFAGTVTAKYARVLNNTQQAARFDLTGFGFNTLAPLTGITGSLGGGMIVYSGSVNSTLDGNLNSLLWTKVQEIGQTITYNFGKQVPLFDVTMYMDTSDYLRQGVIEVSADGTEWTQIGLIDNTGSSKTYVNSFNAGGAKVQYARLRITADDSSWLKVNEFEFNKSMGTQDAQFVSCDIDGRIELSADRNVNSYFTANENKAGAIVYKNVNNKTATEFVVLQDATNLSGAVVTIVSENGAKQIGTPTPRTTSLTSRATAMSMKCASPGTTAARRPSLSSAPPTTK
ncbi:MAG: beta-N-acetylglucosaminidase domain-containing protein, partial [Oscillospiraceae bacterium]